MFVFFKLQATFLISQALQLDLAVNPTSLPTHHPIHGQEAKALGLQNIFDLHMLEASRGSLLRFKNSSSFFMLMCANALEQCIPGVSLALFSFLFVLLGIMF